MTTRPPNFPTSATPPDPALGAGSRGPEGMSDSDPSLLLSDEARRELRAAFGTHALGASASARAPSGEPWIGEADFPDYAEEELALAMQVEDERRVSREKITRGVQIAAGLAIAASVLWVASRPMGPPGSTIEEQRQQLAAKNAKGGAGTVDPAVDGTRGGSEEKELLSDADVAANVRDLGEDLVAERIKDLPDLNGDGRVDLLDMLEKAREAEMSGMASDAPQDRVREIQDELIRQTELYIAGTLGATGRVTRPGTESRGTGESGLIAKNSGTPGDGSVGAGQGGGQETGDGGGDAGDASASGLSGTEPSEGARIGEDAGAGNSAAARPLQGNDAAIAMGPMEGNRVVFEIVVDSRDQRLAGYHAELAINALPGSGTQFVFEAFEGGQPPVFANVPYVTGLPSGIGDGGFSRDARLQIVGFDTGNDLPAGQMVVARVIVRYQNGPAPVASIGLVRAASIQGGDVVQIPGARAMVNPLPFTGAQGLPGGAVGLPGGAGNGPGGGSEPGGSGGGAVEGGGR